MNIVEINEPQAALVSDKAVMSGISLANTKPVQGFDGEPGLMYKTVVRIG